MTAMRRVAALAAALATACAGCAYSVKLSVPVTQAESTRVYAADGSILTTLHAEEDREQVRLDDIAQVARDAVVAIEDDRFFDHRGVDLRALVRAAAHNAEKGKVVEGGSTITQQYVKNVLLDPEKTGRRKLKEAVLAYELERKYTKRTILERYLNTIYMGNGAYGIQAAAHTYFAKPASELTLPEAALLAGMVRSPERYDPRLQGPAALARRNVVLERMRDLRIADPAAVAAAIASPLGLASQPKEDRYAAGYFVERVKRFILDDDRFGATPEVRRHLLFQGGLRIETTVDPHLQAQAEDAVSKVLSKPGADPAAGLVAIDPRSGFVRAVVGGRDFFGSAPEAKFDLAMQGHRQTGSAFKPFVLAAALEAGIPLDKVYPAPTAIDIPRPRQPVWHVRNVEGEGGAPMTLLEATVHSVNTVYAQLIMEVGPKKAVDLARSMGITSHLDEVPAAVLGANAVTVADMASAYATFANDGVHTDPVLVTKVSRSDGTLLYERPSTRRRVLPVDVARRVTSVLEEVVNRGTGINARIGRPVAGKTGTADKEQDAWFVGYTPELVTAVWVGFPDKPRPMTPPATRITVFGGTWPAQIWQLFTSAALAETPVTDFAAVPAPPTTTTTMGPLVTVPSVLGQLEADARTTLTRQGYTVTTVSRPSRDYPPGTVFDQTPVGGTVAPPGSAVTIVVAVTPKSVVVPYVLGKFADEATAALHDAGLGSTVVVEAEPPPGSPARKGKTWKQSPAAGAGVDAGTTVTVWVNPG
jgi:penicillin-binding protein 1A